MAPALANIKAIPLPIPRDAPVTRHTFPVNEGSSDVMVQLGDLLHNNQWKIITCTKDSKLFNLNATGFKLPGNIAKAFFSRFLTLFLGL